jgi:Flp pilus assembly pilin Flp
VGRGTRGTAVADRSPVARQVAAHFIQQAAAPQNASQTRDAIIREDSMSQLVNFVKWFGRNEEGQDLLEYALLVALIALIAIGAVGLAGKSVSTIFTSIAGSLTTAS